MSVGRNKATPPGCKYSPDKGGETCAFLRKVTAGPVVSLGGWEEIELPSHMKLELEI